MKNKTTSVLLTVVLSLCFVIGGITFGNMKSVSATGDDTIIKVSDINNGTCTYYDYEKHVLIIREGLSIPTVTLVLDDEIEMEAISCHTNLTITGDKDIRVNGSVVVYGDLTVDKDVTFKCGEYKSDPEDGFEIEIHKSHENEDEGGNLYFYGNIEGGYFNRILTQVSATFSGASINVDRCFHCFDGYGSLDMINSNIEVGQSDDSFIKSYSAKLKNSSIQCDSYENNLIYTQEEVSIENCDINATSHTGYGIKSYGKISVNGNINISSYYSALDSGTYMDIMGGNMVLHSFYDITVKSGSSIYIDKTNLKATTNDANDKYAFSAPKSKLIYLTENCHIRFPKNVAVYEIGDIATFAYTDRTPCKEIEIGRLCYLKDAKVWGVEDKTYTGQPITQNPSLTYDGITLTEGKDYTVSYSNNTEIGTATITFKAVEGTDYRGEKSVNFWIYPDEKDDKDDDKKDDDKKDEKKYSNEWVDGKWYDADGKQTYKGTLSWKQNETGWWIEDTTGWYAKNQWQKIDGKWYYFDATGYMASNEWIDGYWLSGNGAWEYEYIGSWKTNGTNWWYEDTSGWYPASQWQRIDGKWYYFGSDGIMATDQYIGEYWVGSDGSWQ